MMSIITYLKKYNYNLVLSHLLPDAVSKYLHVQNVIPSAI